MWGIRGKDGGGAEGTGIVLGEIGKREVSLHITD